jgi:serine/threonine protein kinase
MFSCFGGAKERSSRDHDDRAGYHAHAPSLLSRLEKGLLQTSLDEIYKEFDQASKSIMVWRFSRLEQGETLMEHVNRQMNTPEGCISPASGSALVYKSPHFMLRPIQEASLGQAGSIVSGLYDVVSAYQKEWDALLKNLACGMYGPLHLKSVSSLDASHQGRGFTYSYYPILLNEPDGQWWGVLLECNWMTDSDKLQWSLRDLLTVKHSASFISVVASEEGHMLWQNSSSLGLYGCHGLYITSQRSADLDNGFKYNFIDLIFGPDDGPDSLQQQMRSATAKGGIFRVTVEVGLNPVLRSLMMCAEGQEMYLDCHVTHAKDPETLKKILIISQIDVTEGVISQRNLEAARQNLESSLLCLSEEKAKVEAMMRQQADLIECLRWVGEVGRTAGTKARATQLIDSVKRQLTGKGSSQDEEGVFDSLSDVTQASKKIGQGSFGQVVKGKWRDLTVAVKVMTLPAELRSGDRRQAMALMELAISSSLLHPNIVKTHSYNIKPLRHSDPASASSLGGSGCPSRQSGPLLKSDLPASPFSIQSYMEKSPSAFEIQIIMEYCDCGSLQDAFKVFHSGQSGSLDHKVLLDIALDVAKGMQHLHLNNIIHADLKPSNVLLKSAPEIAKGFVAKISDFGLSLSKDDALASGVSGFQHGTRSYQAPEILSGVGLQSNASDVYSFGILFFELITGLQAYANMFHANFDQMVVERNLRPTFPPDTPQDYQDLAISCWNQDRSARPPFEAIAATLTRLRDKEEGGTAALDLSHLQMQHSLSHEESMELTLNALAIERPDPGQSVPQQDQTAFDREFWERVFNY